MGSTRSHPLPPGIFIKMPSPPLTRSQPPPVEIPATSNEFDDWSNKDLDNEIGRLKKRLKELYEIKKAQETVEREECLACEMDEDEEVRVMTEEEVQNDPEMTAQVDKVDHLRAHFC